ncbi:hypothetical protein ABID08_000079 [Rhizobium binae]|uniref:Uncharacterized protein n=1 Tax=Rhizobium binae TaxID=1138190 RepID=A0ABV2M8E2_9HYPH
MALATGFAAPGFVADRHSAKAHGFIRPPFAHLVVIHQMRDSFPLCCGSNHFFSRIFQSRWVEHRIFPQRHLENLRRRYHLL